MKPIIPMPEKNAINVSSRASASSCCSENAWSDSGKISTKETINKTPAASPSEKERKDLLVFVDKNVNIPPIPVDNPAVIVKMKAIKRLWFDIYV